MCFFISFGTSTSTFFALVTCSSCTMVLTRNFRLALMNLTDAREGDGEYRMNASNKKERWPPLYFGSES